RGAMARRRHHDHGPRAVRGPDQDHSTVPAWRRRADVRRVRVVPARSVASRSRAPKSDARWRARRGEDWRGEEWSATVTHGARAATAALLIGLGLLMAASAPRAAGT